MNVTGLPSDALATLAHRRELVIAGLLLAVILLLWTARKVRKVAKSERPDDALSNVVMLIGLGWSSEVVWEITRYRLHFPLGLTLLLLFVFESLLTLTMIRAKRHMREFGWPGRFGTTAWTIAACMALVALAASHSLAEAVLRMVIPLLVVKQWWDGLVGGANKRPADATAWRWTPRRLLLAVGAIEPGERDVHTVHRERLTQQMTTLYHRINHGSARLQSRRTARLARLSLTADDAIIAEVRRRGDRALWFQSAPGQHTLPTAAGATGVSALTRPSGSVTTDATTSATAPSAQTAPALPPQSPHHRDRPSGSPTPAPAVHRPTAPTAEVATATGRPNDTTTEQTTAHTTASTTQNTTTQTTQHGPSAPADQRTPRAVPAPTPPPAPVTNNTARTADGTTAARTPKPAPRARPSTTPTPDTVATRITKPTPQHPTGSDPVPRAAAATPDRRRSPADASAEQLARPATDISVTEPDPAQLSLPIASADLLRRADQVARQYRTEHGEPISPGQLAVRLKVTSEQAAQALAVLGLGPDDPRTPQPAANGNRPNKAAPR